LDNAPKDNAPKAQEKISAPVIFENVEDETNRRVPLYDTTEDVNSGKTQQFIAANKKTINPKYRKNFFEDLFPQQESE